MAGDGGYAAERLGHDGDAKMPVALRGSGMAGVQVAFVLDDQGQGREMALETPAQPIFPTAHAGGSAGAALILPLSQKTCGSMKRNMAMGTPMSLKWTQVPTAKFRAT